MAAVLASDDVDDDHESSDNRVSLHSEYLIRFSNVLEFEVCYAINHKCCFYSERFGGEGNSKGNDVVYAIATVFFFQFL